MARPRGELLLLVRTVPGQDDSDVLLAEGADGEQHGRPLGGDEAEGGVLSGPAAAFCRNAGGLRASVLHHREGLLEGVGHRGLHVEGHRHLCRTHTQRKEEIMAFSAGGSATTAFESRLKERKPAHSRLITPQQCELEKSTLWRYV